MLLPDAAPDPAQHLEATSSTLRGMHAFACWSGQRGFRMRRRLPMKYAQAERSPASFSDLRGGALNRRESCHAIHARTMTPRINTAHNVARRYSRGGFVCSRLPSGAAAPVRATAMVPVSAPLPYPGTSVATGSALGAAAALP